ncbi:MAG: hypothetical protein LKJ88_05815 [Bacilli bacterium]|jgi:hypothetical protein|nr:hypothetical protein [Bacilli bacterium]
MVDNAAIKKNKKKKRIAWITIVAGICVIALAIVAWLSSYVGSFTISVVDYQSKLAMSTSSDMTNKSTFTKVDGYPNATPYTVEEVNSLEALSTLDSDVGGMKSKTVQLEDDVTGTLLYVYTFFATNVGDGPCFYYYGMDITEETSSDSRLISDALRIRIYENVFNPDGEQTHNYIDYTRKNTGYVESELDEGAKTYLANCDKQVADGTLVYFNDGSNIIKSPASGTRLYPGKVLRYTICMWIDGDDPDCAGDYFDSKSGLRLSTYIGSRSAEDQ